MKWNEMKWQWNEMCASICRNVFQQIQHLWNEICLLWKTIFKHATSTLPKGTHRFSSRMHHLKKTHILLNRVCFHQLGIFFSRQVHVLQSHATFLQGIFLNQVKLRVFRKCHVICSFLLQPVPSCKKYCILSDGYALIFDFSLHVYIHVKKQ